MMDANPCASPTDWREDVSGGAGHAVPGAPFVLSKSHPFCPGPAAVPWHFLRFSSVSHAFKQRHRDAAMAHFRSFRFYQRGRATRPH